MKKIRVLVAVAMVSLLGGCFSSYYEVKDPSTDKTYYTTKIKENRDGSVSFTDANTGSNVTIQNSETMKIKKDAFKAAVP